MSDYPEVDVEYSEGICPLCSQFHEKERLHSHIKAEHLRVQEATIRVIQAYNKGWTVEHGACEPCWKSFRDAGRILIVLKQTNPPHPLHSYRD